MENIIDKSNQDISKSHEDSNSFSKHDVDIGGGQIVEGRFSFTEDWMEKENLKLEKEKIKRRRSSCGKYLSEQKSSCDTSQNLNSKEKESVISSSVIIETNTIKKNSNEDEISGSQISEQEKNLPKSKFLNTLDAEIKMYEEKTNQLKTEYSAWKDLMKSRKSNLAKASREYKEAKQDDTCIDEDDVTSQHKMEIKSIMLSQPDYNQYLKQVNFAYEQAMLTEAEVEKVSTICQSFIGLSGVVSRSSYKILEEKTFGVRRDPRDLLRALQEG